MLSQIVRICSGACSTRHVDVPCTKNMKTYVLAVTDTAYRSWHKLKGAAACRRELGGPCSADGTSAGHTYTLLGTRFCSFSVLALPLADSIVK